jgi:hypothetical protein
VSSDELLARLARLNERDLSWLLGELPPALRRDLAGMLADDEPAADAKAPEARPGTGWDSLDAEAVATMLDGEPAWLVSAATRGAPAEWRERLLHAMPGRRRHDIELADRTGRPLGSRAARLVLDGVRTRLDSGSPLQRPAPKRNFAALVDQMRSRFR